MRAPGFWFRQNPTPLARLLQPLGKVWGAATLRRMHGEGASAPVPVICIGNAVAGGAGKTPTALAVADLLASRKLRPVFLSRGYGGRLAGPVLVDVSIHSAARVGDEPLLLARRAPTVVAGDRVAGAALAARHGDVIVMDDGFQNPALRKDISLLVVDAASGIGNGLCLPAGPLRAPLGPQIRRAHGLVLIGNGDAGSSVAAEARAMAKPVLRAHLMPEPCAIAELTGRRVLAFAGIGRPGKFAATLRQAGVDVVELVAFPDHHLFSEEDAARLLARARRDGLLLVTTEKDRARIGEGDGPVRRELAAGARVLPVRLRFEDEAALLGVLDTVRMDAMAGS
jgi:tetraacyldisaccharide 4'-kinase